MPLKRLFIPKVAKRQEEEPLTSRSLGRKFTEAWLASQKKRSRGAMFESVKGKDATQIVGLLTYLEMVVALDPEITGSQLSCIWKLPEPAWAKKAKEPEPLPSKLPTSPEPASPELEKPSPAPATPVPPEPEKVPAQPAPEPVAKESQKWAIARSFKLCMLGEERIFKKKLTVLPADITSVRAGVEAMNKRGARDASCIVYNPSTRYYHCLYQKGERQAALDSLGIDEPEGFLSVSIIAAYNLKKAGGYRDVIDAYAACKVGREEFRSSTVQNNNHPVWNSDEFQFHVNTQETGRKTMHILVWDEKKGLDSVSLGSAFVDMSLLERNQKEKKILSLSDGGVGQVEVELEFVAKKEYGARKGPATPRRNIRRRKPSWGLFEQEMVYDQEISNFLKTIDMRPASESPRPARSAHGYQAKLATYIESHIDRNKPATSCSTPGCGNYFLGAAIFCQMCGAVRQGREEKAISISGSPRTGEPVAQNTVERRLPSTPAVGYFLPIVLNGVKVMVEEDRDRWRTTLDNFAVKPSTHGLAYRRSRNLGDQMPGAIAMWGESVRGFNEGDGWVRCEVDSGIPQLPPDSPKKKVESTSAGQISKGVALRCLPEESPLIFESITTLPLVQIGRVPPGGLVRAAGPPVQLNATMSGPLEPLSQQWFVPIAHHDDSQSMGFVELGMLSKADDVPSGPLTLQVGIVHGKNFRQKSFSGVPTLWVNCLVPGKPDVNICTNKIDAFDPAWQEEHQVPGFEVGDSLEFKVWDKETEMATGKLASHQMFPNGFDDYVPLSLAGTSLRISVSVNKIWTIDDDAEFYSDGQKSWIVCTVKGFKADGGIFVKVKGYYLFFTIPKEKSTTHLRKLEVANLSQKPPEEEIQNDPEQDANETNGEKPSRRRRFLSKIGLAPPIAGDVQKKQSRVLKAAPRVKLDDPDSD